MTHPTRRDVLKALAAAPLALTAIGAAASPVVAPPAPPNALALAEITARAVAHRPLRLYEVLRPGEWIAEDARILGGREEKRLLSWPVPSRLNLGTIVERTRHPILDALAGGDWTGIRDTIQATATELILTGRAYWWAERKPPYSDPRRYWRLPSHAVSPVWPAEAGFMLPDGYAFGGAFYERGDVIRFCHATSPAYVRLALGPQPLTIERLANTYNIPLALLRPEGATRKAAEAARDRHQRYAVEPLCRLIAGTLTRWTHGQPGAVARGWDRLVWAFDAA